MKRLAWFIVVALATLTVAYILWQFRGAILLFLLSLLIAATVRPLANPLTRLGLTTGWALLLLYAVGLVLLAMLLYLIGPRLLLEVQEAANQLAVTYEQIVLLWPEGTPFQQLVAGRLPPAPELYNTLAGEQGILLAQAAVGVTTSILTVASEALIVLVLSIYWGGSHTRFERLWLSLLPAEQRVRARDTWRFVEQDVGDYIRSELVQSFAAGLFLSLGYWGLNLEYPLLLAFLGALTRLIPLLGGLMAVIPAALVALVAGPALAIATTLYTLVIFFILELVVEPHFFNRRQMSSLLLVLIMTILATEFGLLGLILAAPLAVTIQASVRNMVRQAVPTAASQQAYQLTDLQAQLAGVRTMLETMEERPSPKAMSMIERLDNLVKQAVEILPLKNLPPAPPTRSAPSSGSSAPQPNKTPQR